MVYSFHMTTFFQSSVYCSTFVNILELMTAVSETYFGTQTLFHVFEMFQYKIYYLYIRSSECRYSKANTIWDA